MQAGAAPRTAPSERAGPDLAQPPKECPHCGTRYGTPLRVPLPQEARKPIVMEAYVCSRCGRIEFFDPRTGMPTPTTALFLGAPKETEAAAAEPAAKAATRVAPARALQDGDELARTDPTYVDAELGRRRLVRAVAVAGIVVGAALAVYAAVAWPSDAHISNQVPIGVGIYLAGICALADWILGRSFRRQIESVRTADDGLRATLRDGRTLLARWKDPNFAVDCLTRPRADRSPPVSYLMLWPMDRAVTPGELSEGGRSWLFAASRAHGLTVTEKSLGSGTSGMKLHEIRREAEAVKGSKASSGGGQSPTTR